MIHTLENSAIHLEINPTLARWSASGKQRNNPSLENCQFSLKFKRGIIGGRLLDRWPGFSISEPETLPSPHGPLRQFNLDLGSEKDGIHCLATFTLPDHHPLLLWKISIENQGSHPINIDEIELLSAGYIHRRRYGPNGKVHFPSGRQRRASQPPGSNMETFGKDLAFFSNGWQSWSRSGVYKSNDRYQQTRLGLIRAPVAKNANTPHPRRTGMFASDMYGVLGDQNYRNGLLMGFLSQKNHFGSIETWIGGSSPAIRLWANGDSAQLDPGERMETDWACLHFLHLDNPEPLAPYLEAVAREHDLSEEWQHKSASPIGWCSWYQFSSEDYTGLLTAADINHNLEAMDDLRPELPLEIVQIDDGFEAQIGDWFAFQEGFPQGLAPLAAEISHRGFTPGIWLAPFILHPKSQLARRHPDWLLRNRLRSPVNAGFLWNTFPIALDLTHPDALGYVYDVVKCAVSEWGFPYIKLDFLYAGALPGRHRDQTQTRAQILRAGLETIRDASGDETFLLGSGCPLGPAIGVVDGMRIGADTARRWRSSFKGIELVIKDEPSTPGAFNAVHNALTRSDLHQRWWINDPDCLLLRTETHLTQQEVQTIASVIALTGGSLLLSDHLPDLAPERLRIAESLLPLIEKRPYILDWFDSSTPKRVQLDLEGAAGPWHLLAQFNWHDEARDLSLRLDDYYLKPTEEMYAREFWSGRTHIITAKDNSTGSLTVEQVAPHGAVLIALRPRHPHIPQYLGGDLHISQGLEVIEWYPHPTGLSFRLQRPGRAQGRIEITTPQPVEAVSLDGASISWKSHNPGRYNIDLEFYKEAQIEIDYQ